MGAIYLKGILYLPNDEKYKEMQKQMAEIGADVLMSKINALHISYDDKKKILNELKNSKQEEPAH